MSWISRFVAFLIVAWICLAAGNTRAHADKESARAAKDLAQAEKSEDTQAFLAALKAVLEGDDAKSVRAAVVSYSKFASSVLKKYGSRDFQTLHGKAASAFAPVKSKSAVDEFQKLLTTHPDWQGRLLLLNAAGISKPVNRLDAALKCLRDEHPVVARQALQYLAKSKQVPVVDAIIQRFIEISKKKPKQGDSADWERARGMFQSTLKQLLWVDLPAAEDYKSYFDARKSDPKVFDPPKESKGISGLTIFGAAVTGKNIVFVLDTSGSMEATDPLPEGERPKERESGRTVVGDPAKQKEKELAKGPPEERKRMFRAKRELARVVKALPSDIHFNIIDYSSDVRSWKKGMVVASDSNKKAAVEYIDELKAEGITVTDMALEEAFADLNVDTIYLLTDGAPTHMSSAGPASALPEDARQIIAEIHARTTELNFLRGVRIFTLGFLGAHEEFLKKLSAENAGSYVAIH